MYVRDCSNKIGMDHFHIRVASQGREKDARLVEALQDFAAHETSPVVLVVTRRTVRKNKYIDYVGEFHLALLIRLGLLPVMVPVVEGAPACLPQYMAEHERPAAGRGRGHRAEALQGPAGKFQVPRENASAEGRDRDSSACASALRQKLPILGICRGSQLLNVVCGGTLYGDVQKEKNSPLKHIDFDHYDTYRHPISIVRRQPARRSGIGANTLQVNSYHHQGIRDLAPRFKPMAYAEDGLVEAFYDPKAKFVVGLQFHPERMLEEAAGNCASGRRSRPRCGARANLQSGSRRIGRPHHTGGR